MLSCESCISFWGRCASRHLWTPSCVRATGARSGWPGWWWPFADAQRSSGLSRSLGWWTEGPEADPLMRPLGTQTPHPHLKEGTEKRSRSISIWHKSCCASICFKCINPFSMMFMSLCLVNICSWKWPLQAGSAGLLGRELWVSLDGETLPRELERISFLQARTSSSRHCLWQFTPQSAKTIYTNQFMFKTKVFWVSRQINGDAERPIMVLLCLIHRWRQHSWKAKASQQLHWKMVQFHVSWIVILKPE